jgi:2-polyprenyl-3-methyl-5-hydroxy-6-metoxy-1,4-benzoquinol methylase
MDPQPKPKTSLLEREADFWDRHEEQIDRLYARPHDWRLVPKIADRIVAPKIRYIKRVFRRHRRELRSVLDIGCGNGWLCNGLAEKYRIRCYGVDVSGKKIESARSAARARGLTELTSYHACDVMQLEIPEKVDMLTAQGSLHHFPDLERQLPQMVERFLRPGGLMLFVEPNHEGMPPGLEKWVLSVVHHRRWGKYFDLAFYHEVATQVSKANVDEGEHAVRIESPAGREFLGEEPDMRAILDSRYELLEERYFLYFVGHVANVFYIYMKSKLVRGLFRLALPLLIFLDNRYCRKPERQEHAEEGAWLLRAPR